MSGRTTRISLALAVAAALLLPVAAAGQEQDDAGWALFLDNDAFTAGTRDHDYTGGVALTLAGRRAQAWPLSLDPALGAVNGFVGLDCRNAAEWHALQLSVLTFTPADLEAAGPIAGDRPYASIVYLANSRTSVMADSDVVYQTSLAVGVLGLDVAKGVQRALHRAIAADEPRAWDRQVADGGEPTARYTIARLGRLATVGGGRTRLELKHSAGASAGYITEANAALTLRWGRIHTPWWSFVPERAEYMTEPAPVFGGAAAAGGPRELYAWAGIKGRARAYNAFLQGQFRDSELTYDFDDTRPLMGEAWAGVTGELADGYRVSWVLRYQSSELRAEPGDRDLFWGGVSVSRSL